MLFKKYKIQFFILFFILFLLILWYFYTNFFLKNYEIFDNLSSKNIFFLKNINCKDYFKDNFYKIFKESEMTIKNLYVRNVNSLEEYYEKTLNSCLDFSNFEKQYIISLIQNYIQPWFFLNKNKNILSYYNINVNKLISIPWIFIKMSKDYENGLPHTLQSNVISVSPNFFKKDKISNIKTLIHERIHIYQKENKEEMNKYLLEYFIKIYNPILKKQGRKNPDLDEYLYKNKLTNILYYSKFNSSNPKSLLDVKYPNNNEYLEHPLEEMAYTIEHTYK